MTIEQIGNRETQHAEHAGGRGDGKVQRFHDLVSDEAARMGRPAHARHASLAFVIVLKVDVAHGRVIDDRARGQFDGRITS